MSVGTIFERQPDGRIVQTRDTPFTFHVTDHGKLPSDVFGQLVHKTEQYEWLASLFIEMADARNWYSLYRAIEALEDRFGGERPMGRSSLVDGAMLKRAKQMANTFRHLPGSIHKPPKHPISLDEAYDALHLALQSVLGYALDR